MSNEDIAELIESTRQRVQHMGGETPTGAGVVRVLDGLIAMLRGEAPAEEEPAEEEEVEQAPRARSGGAAMFESRRAARDRVRAADDDESDSGSSSEEVPGYLQHLRQTRGRRPVRETAAPAKPANPLSSPQYAGFFNALIASQKGEPGAREAEDQNVEEEEASSEPDSAPEKAQPEVRSTVNPQYKGFFDAMIASQKPGRAKPDEQEPSRDEEEAAAPAPNEPEAESPAASAHVSGSPGPSGPYRDETATG